MGGLAYQVISTPFVGGVETKVTANQVPPAKLLSLVNMIMIKKGAIETRNGSVELVTGPLNSAAVAKWRQNLLFGGFNSELLLAGNVNSPASNNNGSWAQYSMAQNANEWVYKGNKQPLQITEEAILGNSYDHQAADSDSCLGITVFAYEEITPAGTNLNASIIDESTGVILANGITVQNGGSNPRVVAQAANNTISIVFCGSAGDVRISTITVPTLPANPFSTSVEVFPAPDGDNPIQNFEARAVAGAIPYIAVVLYTTNVTTPSYALGVWILGWNPATSTQYIAPALVSNTSYSGTHVGMWVFGANVLVAQVLTTALDLYWYNAALVAGSTASIATGAYVGNVTAALQNRSGGVRAQLFYEVPSLNSLHSQLITLGGALVGNANQAATGVSLAGDAFNFGPINDTPFVPVVYTNNYTALAITSATQPIQPTYFLLDGGVYSASGASGFSAVQARFQSQNAGGLTAHLKVPNVAVEPNGSYFFAILPRSQSTATYGNVFEAFRNVYRAEFVFGNVPTAAVLGQDLSVTGGLLADYDGNLFNENTFNVFPEAPVVLGCPISVIRTQAGVPASGTGVAELTQITFPSPSLNPLATIFGSGWKIQPGNWFTFFTQTTAGTGAGAVLPYYCWYSVDGSGTDPTFSGATSIEVAIFSTDTDLEICLKTCLVINQEIGVTDPSVYASVVGQGSAAPISGACAVLLTNIAVPVSGDCGPGLPGSVSDMFGCLPILSATPLAVGTLITCPSGLRIMPGGYFVIPYEVNDAALVVWFKVDGVGQQPSSPNSGQQLWDIAFLKCEIDSTYTPQQVMGALLAILPAHAGSTSFTLPATWDGWTLPTILSPTGPWIAFSWSDTSEYSPVYNVNASGWAIEANQGGSVGTTGPLLACPPGNGTQSLWNFEVTEEWYDAQLQLHRSAPSLPAPCYVNGAFQGNVNGQPTGGCLPRFYNPITGASSLLCTTLTDKPNVSLVVYRTLINQSVYFRTSSPALVGGEVDTNITPYLPVGPIFNIPGDNSWNTQQYARGFYDVSPDALIGGNPTLYTGGSLANQPPPPPNFVAAHRGRLYIINSEQPNQLWYSQTLVPGSNQAPGFNSLLSLSIPQDGGDCVALCSMDDKLIILCETRVYYIQGDGPDALGNNTNFSAPTLVTADVGCISPYSVSLAADGVNFQSAKGIYLVGRDLSVSYIGAPMESFVQGQIVTSAVLMPDRNERRYGLSNGNIAVYQDLFQQWYLITGWSATATLWQGTYVYLDTYGNPWQESANATEDGTTPIAWTAQTAWIKLSGLQGYQRVSRFLVLGSSSNPITIQAAFNYNLGLTDPVYTYTPNPASPEQARFWIGQQLSESINFKFTGTGTQMLEDLSLELGGIRGIMRLGPAQTGQGG